MNTVFQITTTYEYNDDYRIDVVETPTMYEAWLFHKDYGMKSFIIGVEKGMSKEEFIEIAISEINLDIEIYEDQMNESESIT